MNIRQDKVLDHTREQLSALFDGELALDEARFLERRLQHDAALGACVSHWQAIGDAMRGRASAMAPAGFAGRVAAAVAAEATALPARRETSSRRGWVPGAALAASVALVAFFATRQSPVATPAPGEAPAVQVAQASVPDTAPVAPVAPSPAPVPQAPGHEAAQLAAAMAVAEVPRRAAARRTPATRGQAQRAAATRATRAIAVETQPQFAVAATASASAGPSASPFTPSAAATQQAVTVRPWPRALLPGTGATFNVGYGNLARSALQGETFHPFLPRIAPGGAPTNQPAQQQDPAPQPSEAFPR